MIGFKSVLKFVILFIVAYTIMVLPQTHINRIYSDFLCITGNRAFQNFASDRVITLKPANDKGNGDLVLNVKFILGPSVKVQQMNYNISTNVIGFLAMVFFLAMVIATPLNWKRKSLALIIGFFLMTCFVLLKIRVIVLCCLKLSSGTGLTPDESARASLMFWYDYFVTPISLGFSVAIIFWLGLCIGKKDWQRVTGIMAESIKNKKSANPTRSKRR